MTKKINTIIRFFTIGIWKISYDDVAPMTYLFISLLKKLLLALRFFTTKGVMKSASALTYSTLLAIVPILAVVFAVARGFGFSKYIEVWFRDALSGQPLVAESMIGFVNSYLVHAHSGIILGIGLVFMLWTVVMLTRNIEQTFNNIWQVSRERSLVRTFLDYFAMFFIMPIVIIIISGVSMFMTNIFTQMHEFMLLKPMARFLIKFMPYVFMSIVFVALYVFMPNTKVKIKNAIIPGVLAGVAMQILQYFYVHGQLLLSGYNAIYGSFAALPLFMLWLQISWTICLFGAELNYTSQNFEDFAFLSNPKEISHRYRLMLSALLLSKICKRFDAGKKPYTALELKLETDIPIRVTNDLLDGLVNVRLLALSTREDDVAVFLPATSLDNITFGAMVDRLEADGKWNMEFDMHKLADSNGWRNYYDIRKQYLDNLRNVQVKDL